LFRIAGKTGTALVANKDQGYAEKEYNASFVGYFPADQPRYSCIVVVNRPNSGKIYGGSVAAPVFKEIAEKVYATHLDIHLDSKEVYTGKDPLPDSVYGYHYDLMTCFNAFDYPLQQESNPPVWTLCRTEHNKIVFEPMKVYPDTIPDLRGMNLKDALYLLEEQGVVPIVRGRGLVEEQSIEPGTPVQQGSEIILQLNRGES
jgi:cell division protein FtsI (penicillin-binding protein 3)